MAVQLLGVDGLPEIAPDDDLASMIHAAADLGDGDVVVVTSKVVSKAEGRTVELADVTPSGFATEWAARWDKDPRVVELVLAESSRIVRMVGPVLITETRHGFVCANSGIDQSSSGAAGRVVLLPVDSDASARRMRARFARARRRRRRHRQRHVRTAVARGADRCGHRHRRHRPAALVRR